MRNTWYNVDSSQRDKRFKQAERVRRKANKTRRKIGIHGGNKMNVGYRVSGREELTVSLT